MYNRWVNLFNVRGKKTLEDVPTIALNMFAHSTQEHFCFTHLLMTVRLLVLKQQIYLCDYQVADVYRVTLGCN